MSRKGGGPPDTKRRRVELEDGEDASGARPALSLAPELPMTFPHLPSQPVDPVYARAVRSQFNFLTEFFAYRQSLVSQDC